MAIKRILLDKEKSAIGEREKIKNRFMAEFSKANTVAELRKCLRILSRYVFNEQDKE